MIFGLVFSASFFLSIGFLLFTNVFAIVFSFIKAPRYVNIIVASIAYLFITAAVLRGEISDPQAFGLRGGVYGVIQSFIMGFSSGFSLFYLIISKCHRIEIANKSKG